MKEINKFFSKNKKMIIKPIHSFSGNDIHLFQNKINTKLITSFIKKHGHIMCQKFLPKIKCGKGSYYLLPSQVKVDNQRELHQQRNRRIGCHRNSCQTCHENNALSPFLVCCICRRVLSNLQLGFPACLWWQDEKFCSLEFPPLVSVNMNGLPVARAVPSLKGHFGRPPFIARNQ